MLPLEASLTRITLTTAATARELTVRVDEVPRRIADLERAIFETEQVIKIQPPVEEQVQIVHIRRMTEAFHIPPPPESYIPQHALQHILKTLCDELAHVRPQQKSEQECSTDAAPSEPNFLSNLPSEVWQSIAENSETKDIQTYALLNRKISQTIRFPFGESRRSFLNRIYQKEEAIRLIKEVQIAETQSRTGELPKTLTTSVLYEHLSPKLQMDEEIQQVYIRSNPKGIFDLEEPIYQEDKEDITYRIQFNCLKKMAFLFAEISTRQKIVENEPGIDKILPEFIQKICTPGTREQDGFEAIPYALSLYFNTISKRFPNDPDVVTISAQSFSFASPELTSDKHVVLRAVRNDGQSLQYASETLRNDREVVLTAVRQNGSVLKIVSENFKNAPDIVLAAVRQDGMALRFASEALQNDREIVLAAVRQNGRALGFASADLKNHREVALTAVRQNGLALGPSSKALRNDRELVLTAVRQNGLALRCASKALQNDSEVVSAALRQNASVLAIVSEKFKNDSNIVLAALRQKGLALRYASKALQNDREVVLTALRQDGLALIYASEALRNDREVVLAAVRQNGLALEYTREALRNDREVVLAAVRQNGSVLKIVSEKFKNDRDIVLAALRQKGIVPKSTSESSQNAPVNLDEITLR